MSALLGSVWMVDASSGMEGVRAYIRELRVRRKVSPKRLGDIVGMGRRTIIDWETGATKELKLGNAIRIARALGGSADDIVELVDSNGSADDGRRLAEKYLSSADFAPLEELSDDDPPDVVAAIRELQEELDRLKRRVGLSGE